MNRLRAPAAVLLGLLFLVSGGLKSIDPVAPVAATAAYDLLPAWAALLVGALLPAVEAVVGAGLLLGYQRRAAAGIAIGLGLLFAAANGTAMARGLLVDCQCFGGLGGTAPGTTLVVDLVVVALGWLAARTAPD